MKTIKVIFAAFCLGLGTSYAQSQLKLEEAWKLALEQNHGLKVAKITTEIAEQSVTKGNAGMLPTVNLQGGTTFQRNNTKLDFAGNLPDVTRSGVQNYALNGSVNAVYRIFGGGTAWYNLQQLDNRYRQAVNLEAIAIEGTLLQVSNAFYNLLIQQENVRIWEQSLATNRDRLLLASERQRYGTGTQLERLNAQVNLVTDSINLINAQLAVRTTSRQLALLLKLSPEALISVDTSIIPDQNLELDQATPQTQATAVVATLLALENAQLVQFQNKALHLPVIDANASYGYNLQINEVGVILQNRNLGLNAGLTLSWNLFDGQRRKLLVQNSIKQVSANEQLLEQAQEQVKIEWLDAKDRWSAQRNARQLLETQISAVRMNFQRSMELFKLGQVSSTTFREAQLNLLQVQQLQRQAQVNEKLAEIELKRLSGRLLSGN